MSSAEDNNKNIIERNKRRVSELSKQKRHPQRHLNEDLIDDSEGSPMSGAGYAG